MNIVETLKKAGVVPVIVIEDEAKAVPLARALVKGGLPVLEVTFCRLNKVVKRLRWVSVV